MPRWLASTYIDIKKNLNIFMKSKRKSLCFWVDIIRQDKIADLVVRVFFHEIINYLKNNI